ncbi:MAG TPA: tetratricopeptide repeat protein [Pirellulaceae bacterium]|nr:tetratricopeptide repeat protein [Pirellulaceae bacterium]
MAIVNLSPTTGPARRWLICAGLVLLVVLGWLAAVRWSKWGYEAKGLSLLAAGDFPRAAEELSAAAKSYPEDCRLAFLAAVAFRRAGDADEFEFHLRRAQRLGLEDSEVRLQRLLSRTQHGLGDAASEAALNEICLQGTVDDFTAEQIYEARAKGYISIYQIGAAQAALGYWIEWKPDAPGPRFLRADIAEQQDDMARAEKDYRAILAAHPDNFEALVRLARLLASRHRQDEALTLLHRCAELRPGAPRVTVAVAEIEYALGKDADKVEQRLHEALAADLDVELRSRAWRVLSDVYLDRKEHQKVIAMLEEAAERREVDAPCFQALVRAYFALGNKERAEYFVKVQQQQLRLLNEAQATDRLICTQPDNPDPRFRRGQISLEAGREQDAMTWWYTALLADPLHQPSHEALAKLLLARGDAAKAAQHQVSAEQSVQRTFERAWTEYTRENLDAVRNAIGAIGKYPDFRPHADLLRIAVEIHERQRQLDPASLKTLESLLDYPRLKKYALVVFGSALFQVGQFGAAQEALVEALRLDPNSIQAHRWLAAMYKDTRALDLLYVHCQEWARLDPLDYRPHRLAGLETKSRAGFGNAIIAYQQALLRDPPPAIRQQVLIEMAECQFESSQVEEAIKTLEPVASTVARDILLARCYWAVHRDPEAKQLVIDALKHDPEHRFGNLLRVDIAVKEGELDVAVEHLEQFTKVYPADHTGWFKLSQVYSQLKQREKARECSVKADKLRVAEAAYYDTMEKAFHLPEDEFIRRKLAALARQIGRPDLAEEWERAANLLQTLNAGDAAAPAAAGTKSAPANAIPLIEPKSGPPIAPDSLKR